MRIRNLPSDKLSQQVYADYLEEYGTPYDVLKATAIRNGKFVLGCCNRKDELGYGASGDGFGNGMGQGSGGGGNSMRYGIGRGSGGGGNSREYCYAGGAML